MIEKNDEQEKEMSFLSHLEILRWHLIRSISAIIIFAVVAFIFHSIIFDKIILAPKSPDFFTNRILCEFGKLIHINTLCINSHPFQIINIKMAGQFSMHITVSLISGFIIAFPYVFWESWRFILPALETKERMSARGAVFFSSFLFMIGILFGYYIITPLSVHFLGSYSVSEQVMNQINLGSYISTVSSVVLASGVIFELPILIIFLTRAGLVGPEILKKYRKHAFVVILILAAVITPPDIFSQILVSLPLVVLYEVGIYFSKRITKKKAEELV